MTVPASTLTPRVRTPGGDAPSVPARADAVMPGRVVRIGPWFSMRLRPRTWGVCSALIALVIGVGAWSITLGDFPIALRDVVATLLGRGTDDAEFIVGTLRLPRVLTGVLVGAAFGMSGAIFQSLARNPLGSPDIIGFDSGAATGAVVMIIWFGGTSTQVALGAVAGGLVTAVAVYALAWKRGVRAHRLVLIGIGVGFAVSAGNNYLITRAEINDVQRAAVWLTGSLNGRGWDDVRVAAAALLVLAPLAVLAQRWLDRLELGDDTAAGLGVPVGRAKLALALIGVALAALAVAAAGPIGFVAFVAGPIARRLTRSPGACIVPAAFVGALVVVTSDIAARRLLAPIELPVGIATAVLGAPYLLWLLTRQIRTGGL